MSRPIDRLKGLLDASEAYGDDHVRVTTKALRDILADLQELERRAQWNGALEEAAAQRRNAKREAYEHCIRVIRETASGYYADRKFATATAFDALQSRVHNITINALEDKEGT